MPTDPDARAALLDARIEAAHAAMTTREAFEAVARTQPALAPAAEPDPQCCVTFSLTDALHIVAEGRAYRRSNFPAGRPGEWVGHHTATDYDAAVDVLVAALTRMFGEDQ